VQHAVLIALIVFGVAVGGGLAVAAVRGLQAWRDFRAFRATVLNRLDALNANLARVERRSAKVADRAARLGQARERLQRTLELAAIVGAATGESRSLLRVVRGVVPRK
jgi:hypothetical protein